MRFSLLFIFLFLILFFGCKKEDEGRLIKSGTYTSNDTYDLQPVVLYAKGGAITDTNYIRLYLDRNYLSTRFPVLGGGVINTIRHSSLTFSGEDAIDDSTNVKYEVSFKSGNVLFLSSYDSVIVQSADDGTLGCSNVSRRIAQNPPPYSCIDFGFFVRCTGKLRFPVEYNSKNLKVPFINFYFSARRTNSSCGSGGTVSDFFNSNGATDMVENDTLVIQTSTFTFTRK